MNKRKTNLAVVLLATGMLVACGFFKKETASAADGGRTPEAETLLANLHRTSSQGMLFGHHDDTVYGIGWEGEEGRSDVKDVCGQYPGVISFDLGELELGGKASLDKVPFDKIKEEILNQYQRGGLVSLSWHVRNPKTGGDAWDVSDSTVVRAILPGGELHDKFVGWLGKVADFLNALHTVEGTKIPVLFRPWHEHTGSWFWWGQKFCSDDEYKSLWRLTVDCLRGKGVDHVLYAYSPGIEPKDTVQYLQRYPGDDYIDLLGFDAYQFDEDSYRETMKRSLAVIDSVGRAHHKLIAVTETGYEGVPDPRWWTGTLLPVLEDYPLSYVLVWRNARERVTHHYAPYPGHQSAADFQEFCQHPKTLFAGDVALYE